MPIIAKSAMYVVVKNGDPELYLATADYPSADTYPGGEYTWTTNIERADRFLSEDEARTLAQSKAVIGFWIKQVNVRAVQFKIG
jgi:hypothetical protein